ncbi:hypothetical protein CVT24_011965 [Panaeolus cyanescens]|uniref:Tyrosinase copper-binding domain-containing protein n=1 Tax=Panaeolus cyanescens TaxID=181874 RepID=A0A409VYZ6_9AGAR|nr:hypothetical protein CVT24_011965 [Panaeolus cyanescens]
MLWCSTPLLLNLLYFALILHQGAAQGVQNRSDCPHSLQRREWRTLSSAEQSNYINAVLCLQKLRPTDPNNKIAQSRFDEFQGFHIDIANDVHAVGQFLPWHRYFLARYESALRDECGYTGAQPYWNWSIDVESDDPDSLFRSPIFDSTTGFGGNGAHATYPRCVTTGPFANLMLNYGPGRRPTRHCLTRAFDNSLKPYLTHAAVANTTAQSSFEAFRTELEGQPVTTDYRMHDAGHLSVGGELANVYSSPGDPLFYVHHANLDRIWRMWQLSKPGRMQEISGRSTVDPPHENVTLDYPLNMGPLGPTIPIRDIMDTTASPWCYDYA